MIRPNHQLDPTQQSLPQKYSKYSKYSNTQNTQIANIKGNQPITMAEVTKIVNNLRKNKAMYFDRVPNEMIQILHETQPTVPPILFNHIIQTGLFPTEWSRAYLRPLYKKGNKLRPENYRGIAISPCLGKTFNAILNLRVEEIMDETGISNDMQIGFEKNHRIADHLFVIRTILDQAKICGQDTFLAFTDFKQAYDRVNRNLLFKKFLSNGLPSRIIKVVIDQYQNVQYCVLTPYGRTKFFKSNLGLKQGDTMSPRFFNLFIMDIISIFGHECDPPFLQGCAINVLLFADDLVLLSMSQEGLQKALVKLEEYCREWKLTVNTDKTKVMKLSPHYRSPPPQQQLKYQGCTLEWVNGFTYLGVYVDDRGHMQTAQAPILKKATRAQFKLIHLGKSLNFDTKIWLHQTMVDPILLHGCEIWSVDRRHETLARHGIYTTYADAGKKPLPMEQIKRRCIRMQMGLPRSAPLLA